MFTVRYWVEQSYGCVVCVRYVVAQAFRKVAFRLRFFYPFFVFHARFCFVLCINVSRSEQEACRRWKRATELLTVSPKTINSLCFVLSCMMAWICSLQLRSHDLTHIPLKSFHSVSGRFQLRFFFVSFAAPYTMWRCGCVCFSFHLL